MPFSSMEFPFLAILLIFLMGANSTLMILIKGRLVLLHCSYAVASSCQFCERSLSLKPILLTVH